MVVRVVEVGEVRVRAGQIPPRPQVVLLRGKAQQMIFLGKRETFLHETNTIHCITERFKMNKSYIMLTKLLSKFTRVN